MRDLQQALSEQIPSEIAALIAPLFHTEPLPVDELRRQVVAYRRAIAVAEKTREWPDMDARMGDACGVACLALLDAIGPSPDAEQHLLLHIAVRYFVTADDDEDDLDSLVGFDDDALVVNACARLLGQDAAVIPLVPR